MARVIPPTLRTLTVAIAILASALFSSPANLLRLDLPDAPVASAQDASQPYLARQDCSQSVPGAAAITFAWPPAGSGAREIWIDISIFDNGWAEGTYTGLGPIDPRHTWVVWDGIRPGVQHYYRVNVKYDDGWRTSRTGAFVSGLCVSTGASLVRVKQSCSVTQPGRVKATLAWAPPIAVDGARQYLDLSIVNNGFVPGAFVGWGPLLGAESVVEWDGLSPGTTHYWRVNTLTPWGWWRDSATGAFTTLNCRGGVPSGGGPPMLDLWFRLWDAVNDSGVNAAIAVTDLQTGESISVNGEDIRLPGCTLNLFVLMSVVADIEAGRYPQSDVDELIAGTIYASDPVKAEILLRRTGDGDVVVGMGKINRLLASLGMWRSVYDHPPAYAEWYSVAAGANTLTVNDANLALAHFYNGGLLSIGWRDYLLDKMTGVKPGLQYLLPSGVGDGVTSHKNGFLWSPNGWVDNDLGQRVSAIVWQFFNERY